MAVHRLPNLEDSKREASEWIARLNSDDVSAEDLARFETWKRAHPIHANAYEELLRTWRRFERAGPLMRAVAFEHSMSRSVASPRSRRRRRFAVAATIVIATVLAGLYLQWSAAPTTFRTAVGEQATVSLPDGTSMVLNSDSIARIEYSPRRRIIHLERGEAFFSVSHDVGRPFWVTSGDCWVRAVGTQFDVYRRTTGLQVTVSEGSIRVGGTQRLTATIANEAEMPAFATLSAGQQADVSAASATTRELSAEDLNQAVGWRGGMLYFANRPLADVVTELNRYTLEPIILEDEHLRSLPVGGTFHASPQGAETLLRLLQQSFNVQVQREGTRNVVRGGQNPSLWYGPPPR